MRGLGFWVLFAVLATGCGGPADQGKGDRPLPRVEARFTLSGGPEAPVPVLNGNELSYRPTLQWSANSGEEVRLVVSVEPADKGVTTRVEPAVVKPGGEEPITVTVAVSEAAASGDYKVKLVGKGATAGETSHEITVQVPKKE